MRTTSGRHRSFLLLGFVIAIALGGCATFRLDGCSPLATCGSLKAYSCSGDLTCVDDSGHTVAIEPDASTSDPCSFCHRRV